MSSFDEFIISRAEQCVNAERDQTYTSTKRPYQCRTCGCPCDLQTDMECKVCSKRPDAAPLIVDEQLRSWAYWQGHTVVVNIDSPQWDADHIYRGARRAAHWARLLLLYCEQDRAERRSA